MLPTIERSEKFQNEYNNFSSRIDAITDENVKAELNLLLKNLVFEVRAIDKQHDELMTKHQLPSMVTELRTKIMDIRKRLSKRLEEYEIAHRASNQNS